LGFFQLQIDSIAHIEIASSAYPTMQVEIPEVNSFKIELTKPSVTDKPVDEVFTVNEEPASFPGGMQSFYNYIGKNMKFPREVKNGTINGKVLVDFVVDSTGQIPPGEIKIKQGLCKACDEEAIRLIKGSPKWNPGLNRNKPVGQRMILPITFRSN
jgi:protein TonB